MRAGGKGHGTHLWVWGQGRGKVLRLVIKAARGFDRTPASSNTYGCHGSGCLRLRRRGWLGTTCTCTRASNSTFHPAGCADGALAFFARQRRSGHGLVYESDRGAVRDRCGVCSLFCLRLWGDWLWLWGVNSWVLHLLGQGVELPLGPQLRADLETVGTKPLVVAAVPTKVVDKDLCARQENGHRGLAQAHLVQDACHRQVSCCLPCLHA